ncbi:MAG: EAL domain-containing protein [Gammaproteobacteria bacterium]|nr:EAL domain-containing protein [Gammaproteobacteria bacterium]MBU3996338.1 EAL domain-containing protein [Gammaproteobacteria bacterium]MBU4080689.1 EAL domain-containing protein [Gammaproteobacteria bacterium]MBU4113521.1 EAL domain-containing protein [Gammaproteobacteria bacterium]MBU4170938.1 EAL domain-containing protein [Gammaproteobacteria bacterium]
MHATHSHPYQKAAGLCLLALALPLLWWVSSPARQHVFAPGTFVFFHNLLELFAVVVAMLIFMTGYRAVLSAREGAVVLLGVMFLGVGLLDLLHALSYVGMPDALSPNSPHKSMFFWLAARLLAALALLAYVGSSKRSKIGLSKKRLALLLMLALVGLLGLIGLRWPERVPALFVPGQGLSPLKIGLEWLVISLNLIALAVLWQRRAALAQECGMALGFALALSAVSEFFFTQLGVNDQDGANAVGHFYKGAAYLYLLHATFNEALRRPLAQLAGQHLREQVTLKAAPDGVLWVDQAGRILMANPAMDNLSGYATGELVGQNVSIFLPEHLRAEHAQSMLANFKAPHPRPMGSMDLNLLRRDGQLLPVDISLGYWDDEGTQHAIAYVRDLSERREFEASLKHQASHDELTGLPNRWLFNLQLNQALARSGRAASRVAVLFLDLDHFKNVNDSYGHAMGDALLVQVSARMRSTLRTTDLLARLGGDEFGILLTDLASADEAVIVASKLLLSLQASYQLPGRELYSGASVGLAFYPHDAQDSDTLLRYADMAMYRAKQAGRGAYALYSKEMDGQVREDMELHTHLKQALAQGALQLHYQPQVDVATDAIVGAEALLRWFDPVLGQVSPARIIPVAEATGLILQLSDWVLETACTQIAAWAQAGTPLRVAVNFSAQQFNQPDLAEIVGAALARSGAQAHLLVIEITESVAMKNPEQAREQLGALVALGCRVALDDFGTGYSSLAYLKALPIHKLKIDKSFMDGIPLDASDMAISKTIIAMAHSLGMALVAEGVETDAQLAFLRQYGCEAYQGWLFAKAMPAPELTQLMRAGAATGDATAVAVLD